MSACTSEDCSDDVDSNADSDPAVDDSEASSSDGDEEAMDRLRQVVNLLGNCAPNHLQLEYDTMQAKRQAIMSSNLLWSAEEKADYGQWPLILGDRRKADEWTLKDTIPILKLPLYMATEVCRYCKTDKIIPHRSSSYPSLAKPTGTGAQINSLQIDFATCLKNIVAFLTARAEGPIPRVTGGSDRPTIPYAERDRVIVKPRAPKKVDLMPRSKFMRQPDGNACGVFICRTMENWSRRLRFSLN
ncbi:BQ5605_C017g08423 [Microbotryum silenes-dioicae]|uniref:BQ5605_C017g08423 protein n=1 Tax=Microbotryum silenes-dioicae TaxID=796604 RepID=A0A2X0NYW8_9BASI|nr:BQ5605_C017g08423 [Microbotryum silenes-dioicae]